MPSIAITDFACLKNAVFELAPVNIIIGPQGSGKSVTTKLFYFFSDIPHIAMQFAERGDSIEDLKKSLTKQFNLWFPPSAWGVGRFNINYTAGDLTVRVLRRRSNNRLSEEVSIKFSEYFVNFYDGIKRSFNQDIDEGLSGVSPIDAAIDRTYRYKEIATERLALELGDNFIAQQTFIPAGRAFFTSIGRLVAGFEQAGSLDPVTIKFARLFASIRDRAGRRYLSKRRFPEFESRRQNFMEKLFGGELKYEDDLEFVETIDGRKIPFTALSSGQQELLPMWSLIDYFSETDYIRYAHSHTRSKNLFRELVYIEEPEAHLFPSAQSMLMEFLIGSIASSRNKRSLIITTHSPYIMSKINVFLKAGQLARRKKRNEKINEIVPRECWLNETQLSALSIEDGELRNLIDEDGLVDARYLDSVSEDISREFSGLLAIEDEILNG